MAAWSIGLHHRTHDGVAAPLLSGPNLDWVKNSQAAIGARVKLGGKTLDVTDLRIVPASEAVDVPRSPWRQVLGPLGVESALLLTRAG